MQVVEELSAAACKAGLHSMLLSLSRLSSFHHIVRGPLQGLSNVTLRGLALIGYQGSHTRS